MDNRFQKQGYTAEFTNAPYGAFLTLKKNNEPIKEISIGFMDQTNKLQIMIKHFDENGEV